ncbi:MAG: glycine betaine ABC transporter substrate-binding protein [Thermoleophilia bacterium]|nr:glycine betaine ABC transporter substrate-binding protein [Thermoleophilia bacterium]
MSSGAKKKTGVSQKILIGLLAALLLVVLSLAVTACGDEEPTATTDAPATTEATATTQAPPGGDLGEVRIGWIAWDECIATTYLWKRILEDEGYGVTLTQLDAAPVYAGLAAGDIDFFTDAWLPTTHEDYWNEYGDQLEDINVWYDKGTLELTVPTYLEDINSIADLKGKADMFGGAIVGIEPGAGLTRLTREAVMPGYELEGYELLEGSTPAMLAELDRAIDREEPIVVTLWRPHWVYAAHDLKDLDDPQGLFGEGDKMHILARLGFSEDLPAVAGWLANFRMDDDSLANLSQIVIDDYGSGREEEAVEAWLSEPENQALVDGWLGK